MIFDFNFEIIFDCRSAKKDLIEGINEKINFVQ